MEQKPQSEVEAKWGDKAIKLTGNDIGTLVTLILTVVAVVVLGLHYFDSKEGRMEFVGAIKEMSQATRDQTSAQREQNCLFKFKPEERHQWAEWCKTNSK